MSSGLLEEVGACYQHVRELGPKRLSEFDCSTLPRIDQGAAAK